MIEQSTVSLLLKISNYAHWVNVSLALGLYLFYRNRVQRTLLFFWSGLLISTFASRLFPAIGIELVVVVSLGTFTANLFLSSFFLELSDRKLPLRPLVAIYALTLALAVALFLWACPFWLYALFPMLAVSAPLIFTLHVGKRNLFRKRSLTHALFLVLLVLRTLHFLIWPFVRENPQIYFMIMAVTIVDLYLISLLAPMLANERSLKLRNDHLEEEIERKAEQLTSTRQKLWEARRLASLGRIAGGVAHELSNPLQIIDLVGQTVRSQAERGELSLPEVVSSIAQIDRMVERISQVSHSLRKISREQLTGNSVVFDLQQTVATVVEGFRQEVGSSGISIHLVLQSREVSVVGDPHEIANVLFVLLSNARDAVRALPQPEIRLEVHVIETGFRVAVEDSGRINPQVIPLLMEPFFTTKRPGEGTGLGLSLAKSIVDRHRGRLYIDASSERTRFILELPGATLV